MTALSPSLQAPAYDIDAWRRQIPLLGHCIPMNNCSQAPQTRRTRDAAERYLDGWNSVGMDWDAWMAEVALAKAEFARVINAPPDSIAVFSSVSEATSAVASALDFSAARSRVVVTEAEFPTIGHVWLAQERRGARVSWVPVDDGEIRLARYDAVLDREVAIVSATHGYYLNGFVQPVRVLADRAHAAGALLYV
ncbi:MAG: aminotransferase class V-fold PLP-dependent enzyme, partial [Gemmatimonadaceae bacterium]